MKKPVILVLIVLFSKVSFAQLNLCEQGVCYKPDVPCYTSSSQINRKCYTFGSNANIFEYTGITPRPLLITIYSPCILPNLTESANCTTDANNNQNDCSGSCKRPFIMLMHGGGFRGACREDMEKECLEFAKRGFVAATIDYRLGYVAGDGKDGYNLDHCVTKAEARLIDNKNEQCDAGTTNFNLAIYRGLQDANAALRFVATYADQFHIYQNNMFIGGQSAGSVIAANTCYMQQSDLDLAYPGASTTLGPVNTADNTYTASFKVVGLYNNWGGIPDVSAYITGTQDKIPMIAFHGVNDIIVPFERDNVVGCNRKYDSQVPDDCGAILQTGNGNTLGQSDGSKKIYDRLSSLFPDIPLDLFAVWGGHGIFDGNPLDGSGNPTPALYRIERAVCFFRKIFLSNYTAQTSYIGSECETVYTYSSLKSQHPYPCTVSNPSLTGSSGVEKIENKTMTISISPNPVKDVLIISGLQFHASTVFISLVDLQGRSIRIISTKEVIAKVPVANLTPGTYMVRITEGDKTITKKFVKQ